MKPYTIEDDFDKVLVNGFALRAYVVRPTCADEREHATLVFAQSEEMACEIGAPELEGEPEGCEARPAPEHDARAALYLAGCVERNDEFMRSIGWHLEGESTCGCCGLAPYGMEKYGICRMSGNCKECGCDDDDTLGPCDHEDGFEAD